MSEPDALIGLRFEVGGGLGRMTGRVLGKAGHLYVVQKTDADYFELLELDDLRSAKFFPDHVEEAPAVPATTVAPRGATGPAAAPVATPAPVAAPLEAPVKRRLSEQLRRRLSGRDG